MYYSYPLRFAVYSEILIEMEEYQQSFRSRILYTHMQNPGLSQRGLEKLMNIQLMTISTVLKRFQERMTADPRPWAPRKPESRSKPTDRAVAKHFKRNPNVSTRDLAIKLILSRSFVQRAKKRLELRTCKVQNFPNRNERQQSVSKTRTRKLYTKLLTNYRCCVIIDKTYIKADFK